MEYMIAAVKTDQPDTLTVIVRENGRILYTYWGVKIPSELYRRVNRTLVFYTENNLRSKRRWCQAAVDLVTELSTRYPGELTQKELWSDFDFRGTRFLFYGDSNRWEPVRIDRAVVSDFEAYVYLSKYSKAEYNGLYRSKVKCQIVDLIGVGSGDSRVGALKNAYRDLKGQLAQKLTEIESKISSIEELL